MNEIRTSKQRDAIPFTKVGDFPYNEVEVEILYYTSRVVWIGVKNDGIYRISRPRRYAWTNLEQGMMKTLTRENVRMKNKKDELKNYFKAFFVKNERNDTIPYDLKMSVMG